MSDKKRKLIIAVSAFAIYCVIFFSVIGIKLHFNTNQNDPDLIVEEMPLEESDPVPVPEPAPDIELEVEAPTAPVVTVPDELDVEFSVDPADHVGYMLLTDYDFWPDYDVLPENNSDTLNTVTTAVEEYLTNNGYAIPDVLYADGYSCLEPNTFSIEVYYEDTVRLLVYYSADTKQVSVSEFPRNEDYDS